MKNNETLTTLEKTHDHASVAPALLSPRPHGQDRASDKPRSNSGRHINSGFETTTIPNLEAVKARQKATWESGDFGQIARTIENVAEEFMAAIHPGRRGARRGAGRGISRSLPRVVAA
jgi:hypothetical protein